MRCLAGFALAIVVLGLVIGGLEGTAGAARKRRADTAAIERLLRRAPQADAAEREATLARIVAMGDGALATLFARLEAADDAEARIAGEALVRIGGEAALREARQRFARQQGRPTPDTAVVRGRLLGVYARLAGKEAVGPLTDALFDDSLRDAAAAELEHLGPSIARELVILASEKAPLVQEVAIRILKTMPEAAAPLVVPLFERESDQASEFAGMLLAELPDPAIVPELVALIRERRAHNEADVLRALAIYDVPAARAAVAEGLDSEFPYLRFAAVEVVRGWQDDAALALVKDRLAALATADRAEDVQAGAVTTLLAHWSADAEPLLLGLLQRPDTRPLVRAAAAKALGFLGTRRAVEPLVELLEEAPSDVAEALRRTLRRLTYLPEDTVAEGWTKPAPALAALGEPLELERLEGLPEGALPAWQAGEEDGPAIVVVGGLPGFDHQAIAPWLGEDLADEYRIVAVDLPPLPPPGLPVGAFEQAFHQGLLQLAEGLGLKRFSLVGHDAGAVLALRFAARMPDRVERLVLIDMPLPSRRGFDEANAGLVARLPSETAADLGVLRAGWKDRAPRSADLGLWRVVAPGLFVQPANAVIIRDLPAAPALGRGYLEALGPFDVQPDFEALAVPVLLLMGEDSLVPADHRAYYRLRQDSTGGRQRFVRLAGAAEFPYLEKPTEFRAELADWLPSAE